MELKEIELNILYWLWKGKLTRGLRKDEKVMFKRLCDKYPSESFSIFNILDIK